MLRVVTDGSTSEERSSTLDEICREGARRMLATALELEAGEYVAAPRALDRCDRPAVGDAQRARPGRARSPPRQARSRSVRRG
jgi:hypothetical protein